MRWVPRVGNLALTSGHFGCETVPLHVLICGVYDSGKLCRVISTEPCPRCGVRIWDWMISTSLLKKPLRSP